MSGQLLSRLQSVLNAAARLVFSARKSDHVSPLLHELHWLRVPDRIRFQLCVLVYRCLNGAAPTYLADSLRRIADVDGRRRLCSSVSDTLVVAPTNRSTLGDRASPVAASRAWNGLLFSVRAASSLSTFRQELKTFLFRSSFQWLTRQIAYWHCIQRVCCILSDIVKCPLNENDIQYNQVFHQCYSGKKLLQSIKNHKQRHRSKSMSFWSNCIHYSSYSVQLYTVSGKNGPPKENAVKCTVYNTIQ